MKQWALTIVWIWLTVLAAYMSAVEDRNWEDANVLLVKASNLEAFSSDHSPKFRLHVNFIFQHTAKGKRDGTFIRDFVSPEHWSDELILGDFHRSRVRIDKKIWTTKNDDFMPLQVDLLFQAVFTTSFLMTVSDSVDRLRNRKIDGVETRCVEFQNILGRLVTPGELCVDRSSGSLAYWRYGTREIWYSQYAPFASALRPLRIVVAQKGLTTIEAQLTYTESPELSADSFQPIKDGAVTDTCSNARELIVRSAPEPMHPRNIARRELHPVVTVKAEVDEAGRVIKDAVVEPVLPQLDDLALNAVKSWTFEPKLCDGKPVRTTTWVDVHFR
jgi:TonB family protein